MLIDDRWLNKLKVGLGGVSLVVGLCVLVLNQRFFDPVRRLETLSGARDDPPASALSRALGVKVEKVPNERRQYSVIAEPHTVDFSKIGTVQADLGYAVGVTLRNGMQIGFRYKSP